MSKKLKLSPWHDGSVKPVHVGVYEGYDDYNRKSYYSWFNGKIFNGWWHSIEAAIFNMYFGAGSQVKKWRGVLK